MCLLKLKVKLLYLFYRKIDKKDITNACVKGYTNLFKWMVSRCQYIYNCDILIYSKIACRKGHLEILRFLMEKSSDIKDYHIGEFFNSAYKNKHLHITQWFLKYYAHKFNMNLFVNIACQEDKLDIAECFYLYCPNLKITDDSEDIFKIFDSFATKSENKAIKWLLEKRPDIVNSEQYYSSFYSRCYRNDIETAKILYENNPNLDIKCNNHKLIKNLDHYKIACWLASLNDDYTITKKDDGFSYRINPEQTVVENIIH